MQVRAAALSGDCEWAQEAWRGNVSLFQPSTWRGFKERCIERRAALSVGLNPKCRGSSLAASAAASKGGKHGKGQGANSTSAGQTGAAAGQPGGSAGAALEAVRTVMVRCMEDRRPFEH